MLGKRRKKDDDIIGPSKGLMKWINRLFRFILYPFIHPVWFIIGVVVLAVAVISWPAYYGVEVAAMPNWYKQKFNHYYNKFEAKIPAQILPKPEPDFGGMTGRGINVKALAPKPGKADIVTYETPQMVNRRAFQQAQEIPVDVAATLKQAEPEVQGPVFKRNDNLGLTYLEQPRKVSGKVTVINANELKIGNELFFLYGIYASPVSNEGIAAQHYLKQNIDGREADCFVGAYAADGTATAICIYEGLNINQRLVDLKYSRDVSLN